MHLKLYQDDSIRCSVDHRENTFTDIRRVGFDSLAIDLYGMCGYVELRLKDGNIRIFQFPRKSYKKECDFGYWSDAEVVYSYNRDGKDKE
jgi:hypothetical protein